MPDFMSLWDECRAARVAQIDSQATKSEKHYRYFDIALNSAIASCGPAPSSA